jgi:hypothetical protein
MMFVIFMKLNETKIWSKFLTTPGRVPARENHKHGRRPRSCLGLQLHLICDCSRYYLFEPFFSLISQS